MNHGIQPDLHEGNRIFCKSVVSLENACHPVPFGASCCPMKHIATALDFSDASDSVLNAAMAMAQSQQATLHIVHVLEPQPSYTAYGMTPEEFPAIQLFQEESQKRAEAKLHEALATARQQVGDVRIELMIGSPLHAIIDYVKEKSIDLIVIGSHGHGAVAALLIGSVAEGLVRKAICPTLVIPCHIPS
ncbi:MAG: hypothetical protein RI957_1142 [Verrucomicrobiota bacterium]|jgi:universal stress protein A